MEQSSKLRPIFQNMQSALKTAFGQSAKRFGLTRDPDLSLYNRLTPDDFKAMSRDFGETNVLQYIQEMEKKRLLE